MRLSLTPPEALDRVVRRFALTERAKLAAS
jgi:hypothetical protein